MEVGLVVDREGRPIYWHRPPGRTLTTLPDCRLLWTVLFSQRHRLGGFAHTHPGAGVPAPSREDLSTFSAVERGLGRRLDWWIASEDALVRLRWAGPEDHAYASTEQVGEPAWLRLLRAL